MSLGPLPATRLLLSPLSHPPSCVHFLHYLIATALGQLGEARREDDLGALPF